MTKEELQQLVYKVDMEKLNTTMWNEKVDLSYSVVIKNLLLQCQKNYTVLKKQLQELGFVCYDPGHLELEENSLFYRIVGGKLYEISLHHEKSDDDSFCVENLSNKQILKRAKILKQLRDEEITNEKKLLIS